MDNRLKDREYMHKRHRLSYQQIDSLLGESSKKAYMSEKISQLETVKAFLDLTDSFKDRNIFFVPLKGCLLSQRIYGDPTVRCSHDIDILVSEQDLERSIALMLENGFEMDREAIWPEDNKKRMWIIKAAHHIVFFHKKKKIEVELHWSMGESFSVSTKKSLCFLRDNLTDTELAGRTFKVMSPEFELVFLLMHGSRHAWARLKWLMDIRDYPIDGMDMDKFYRLVNDFKADRLISQAKYLLDYYFDSGLSFSGSRRINPYILRYPMKAIDNEIKTDLSVKDIFYDFVYQWLLFPSLSYRLRTLDVFFFRPNDIENLDVSCKLIYYFYRPYSLIKRRIFHA